MAACGPAAEVAPTCPVAALPLTVPYPERTLTRMVWEWTPTTVAGDEDAHDGSEEGEPAEGQAQARNMMQQGQS